ncbi:Transposon Ty3-I Gag-Pol polyprotein [Labeo rohita]|uniref:Transposon Ty3-I Gag-Pol polyprotein n=1 Tax=Labeo rohita TaxID=84645 RepID=A0ABQ8L3D0_LABRO|nr:Transposon Ty3-I Gag-Pol polyprotein [Labeo rohita]
MAVQHRDVVLAHMKELGLRLKRQEKCAFSTTEDHLPGRGVGFDLDAGMSISCLDRVDPHLSQESQNRPVTHCQTVLDTVGSDGSCVQQNTFWPATWRKCWFLNQGPVLGAPCRCVMLATDTSLFGWGAVISGHPARGLWSGHHLTWHINRLEMLAVFQALKHFLPDLRDRHVLVRTDNTSVASYINHKEGLRSCPLYKLAHQILVWSQWKLLSLRAVYIPGHLYQEADVLLRQGPRPGEWRLHPEVVELIWRVFGQAQVDLFATLGLAMSPLVLSESSSSPGAGCHGTDVAQASSVRLSPDRSAPRSSGESVPGRHLCTAGSPVLARLSMVLGPDFPPRQLSMGDSCQEGSPLTSGWHDSVSPPGVVEAVGVHLVVSGLSTEVVETILHPELPHRGNCMPGSGDSSLPGLATASSSQSTAQLARFPAALTHSTLKVYVAAIAAFHSPLGGQLVGKHPLVTRVLHGALRLRSLARLTLQSMAASKAFLSGVPLSDICNVAGWSTPLTFVRFYGLAVHATPGSSVLSS